MYQLITTYSENEPWWFFDDWEDDIVEETLFADLASAQLAYQEKFAQLQAKYSMMKEKPDYLTAFWNEGELLYCDDCDEDLQQYKGLMLLRHCRKLSEDGKDNDETTNYHGKTKCCKRSS
ncbi:DUF1033 family protein [Vagococcus salmoninarum]|uniref:DNA-binding protein n=1 Tax=Vagococcus salmoninarum TaxID=2739 RepID=A0A429ZTM1_9ENTE|nr:DUF1033 family protein [Vagococcus salmoninarum]RST97083.1 DNA-binding protein [Vagococcus salmoninarum]